jgi:hypothetical protein
MIIPRLSGRLCVNYPRECLALLANRRYLLEIEVDPAEALPIKKMRWEQRPQRWVLAHYLKSALRAGLHVELSKQVQALVKGPRSGSVPHLRAYLTFAPPA